MTGVCLTSSLLMTGCIDETFPTNGVTEDQLAASNTATSTLLWAMPGVLNQYATIGSGYHWDWGYGSIMHVRDVMTEDMAVSSSGYDWYTSWEQNMYQGESYVYGQFIWNYYYQAVLTTNNLIGALDPETASDVQMGYLAAGHAFRALFYLDMARMYEFLPNDRTSASNVEGLTVPIVDENTTEEDARNNPRASRDVMAAFILEDLDFAEQYIGQLDQTSRTLPHLAAVYGLKARYYMWLEDYANAQQYARLAINAADVDPMSETECLSTTSGFNNINCWIWGSQMVTEDDVVQSGILNWTSWMSNETSFGYAGQAPYVQIGKSLYDRLNDTDFRKKMWKAPEGSALDGETEYLTSSTFGYFGDRLPEYASVKFRPAEGNCDDYTVGAASAYPLMRVEEMYFIEAEAAAQQGSSAEAQSLLTSFMTQYRDASYSTSATGEDLIDEIVFQKRIELWGEGLVFFDVKRLDMSVTRGYTGTNFSDAARFNTDGRPAWMNICIVQTEKNNNSALIGYENPDPSGLYTVWTE